MEVHFSSKTDNWATPLDFFQKIDEVFEFTTDVCASHDNHKCENYFTKGDDGLNKKWEGVCWMNPPYGREISKWIEKAYVSGESGTTVVCLIPSRTDTAYMHKFIFSHAKYVGFVKGRLKFGGSKNPAPFPSLVAVFTKEEYPVEDINIDCKWVTLR